MERQLVVFLLAGEYYGVDIFMVERIIDMQPVARVPHAPNFVKGVMHLSDLVLPILDLRQRFGLPDVPYTGDSRIVVVSVEDTTVGMVVDAVAEVIRIADKDIAPPPALVLTSVNRAFIAGIAKVTTSESEESDVWDGRLVVLLNLSMVLSSHEVDDLHTFEEVLVEESAESDGTSEIA